MDHGWMDQWWLDKQEKIVQEQQVTALNNLGCQRSNAMGLGAIRHQFHWGNTNYTRCVICGETDGECRGPVWMRKKQ